MRPEVEPQALGDGQRLACAGRDAEHVEQHLRVDELHHSRRALVTLAESSAQRPLGALGGGQAALSEGDRRGEHVEQTGQPGDLAHGSVAGHRIEDQRQAREPVGARRDRLERVAKVLAKTNPEVP